MGKKQYIDPDLVHLRSCDWRTLAVRIRDATNDFQNRDIVQWAYKVASVADARSDECEALLKLREEENG